MTGKKHHAEPMSDERRIELYKRSRTSLTATQMRRLRKKARRRIGKANER